ncbi:MAG: bifunctional 3,4-dihydroxy-2-butanone-4-phosphate synthase/GTP cyclohydrolase II [Elusimicrobia bacterium]|nr:bifunctional 3,4-dihydroxy-2-butanone-4-phosphate synthase/GTP cyclohydrolase II [Elusimicrobiota bacterium]
MKAKKKYQFATIDEAIDDIRSGKMVIVIDDPNRENEGDLVMAADKVTPEAINFMITHARGLVCVPMQGEVLDRLKIPQMVPPSASGKDTAFSVSVDGIDGVETGISAHDRAKTVELLINPDSRPEDLRRPGHIFPLRYREGGVLVRAGHTEASVDLSRMAGLFPAGIICEIINSDGSMARLPELMRFAAKYQMGIITIAALIEYRRQKEQLVECVAQAHFPTHYGKFELYLYRDSISGGEHLALTMGEVAGKKDVLVRVHSSCITGDTLHSLRCDCGEQKKRALEMIAKEGAGVFLYLNQEGRGVGLANKIKAYQLQDQGLDTVEANQALGFKADLREYGIGAQILKNLGLTSLRILTNNPKKIIGIEGHGLAVTERLPLQVRPSENGHYLMGYLKVKKEKMGHMIDLEEMALSATE